MPLSNQWRMNITANGSGNNIVGVVELEYFDSVGSVTNLAVGGTSSSSSDNFSYVSSRAFDGIKNDHGWYTANNNPTGWLSYNFTSPVDIKEIALTVPDTSFGNDVQPKNFQIQYYNSDSMEWINVAEFIDELDWEPYETRRYTIGTSIAYNISGKCVRGHLNLPAHREIYVYSMEDGEYLGYGETDEYGQFSINVSRITNVFLRIVDPEGIYSTEIRENIIPIIIIFE